MAATGNERITEHRYSNLYRDDALQTHPPGGIGGIPVTSGGNGAIISSAHPFARVFMSFANFSISSAFFNMASDSTLAESVFSTSSLSSLAN
jgi:hypothetical protein